MNWKSLLSPRRFGQAQNAGSSGSEIRSEFQRDYDRIIFSSPFRRLQNKTQVFPLPGSVFVHNRLTHSIEVASVGRSLGNVVYQKIAHRLTDDEKTHVREIDTVVATACLAHDLGNPPFGHSGEKAISHFFSEGAGQELKNQISAEQYADLVAFEGNANLLRLLTHQFQGRRKGGYVLTYASLGTMIKYPFGSLQASKNKKYGFFQTEIDTFADLMQELRIPHLEDEPGRYARHPLVYLMEAADDICYQMMDLEDAHKLGIISREKIHELFLEFYRSPADSASLQKIKNTLLEVTDVNEQIAYLRAMVIGKLVWAAADVFSTHYDLIMQGKYASKLLKDIDPSLKVALEKCGEVAYQQVYKHPSVVKIEISGYKVIGALLEEFYDAVMHSQTDYAQKMLTLMPLQYHVSDPHPYVKARSVVDFVSGMTDVYAVDLFKQIKGLQL
ncbi:MAG: deoxyguanosinetriphosphate triphosphohydrolase [Bacteroidales bacterium]